MYALIKGHIYINMDWRVLLFISSTKTTGSRINLFIDDPII